MGQSPTLIQTQKTILSLVGFLIFFIGYPFLATSQDASKLFLFPDSGSVTHFFSTQKNDQFGIISGFSGSINHEGINYTSKGVQDLLLYSGLLKSTESESWILQISNKNRASATDLIILENGDLICSGIFWDTLFVQEQQYATSRGSRAIFIICIDHNGSVKWVKILEGLGAKEAGPLVVNEYDEILFSGNFENELVVDTHEIHLPEGSGLFVLVMNSAGDVEKFELLAEGRDLRVNAGCSTGESFYLTGQFKGELFFGDTTILGRVTDWDLFIVNLHRTLDVTWVIDGKGVLDNIPISMKPLSSGMIAVGGHMAGRMEFSDGFALESIGPLFDAFIFEVNQEGQVLEGRTFFCSNDWIVNDMDVVADKYMLSGTFDGTIEVEGMMLSSSFGVRSGVLLGWSFETGLTGLYQASSTTTVSTMHFSWIDSIQGYFVINFSGEIEFMNLYEDAETFFKSVAGLVRFGSSAIFPSNSVSFITAYPNPVRDQLYFSSDYDSYSVFNVDGILIKSGKEHPVDVSSFPAGTYLLLVNLKDLTSRTLKIIVH